MKIETPQILWHSNADADQGRAAPLYAVSMLPVESTATAANNTSESSAPVSRNVLATVGNTPEIHLWEVGFSRSDASTNTTSTTKNSILQQSTTTAIRHIQTLGRSIDRSLNAVSFSPCGRHLAAAGDGGVVVVYTLPPSRIPILDATEAPGKNGRVWCDTIGEAPTSEAAERLLRVKILPSPTSHDVMDLSWSGDSKRLTVGCLDHAVVTYENVHHGDDIHLTGFGYTVNDGAEPKWTVVHRSTSDHTAGYVQGVAADPRGIYLASQGSDRTVRVWCRKGRKGVEKTVAQQLSAQREGGW